MEEIKQLETSWELLEKAKSLGVTGAGVEALSAITSQSLSGNATPLNIPPTPISTTAVELSGMASAVKDAEKARQQFQQEQEVKAQEAEKSLGGEKGKIRSLMDRVLGVQESRIGLETEAKLPEKAQRVTDYTNQLEGLERAELNAIRSLEGAGLTDVQRAANQREIQRRFAFEKADVALLQSAANRDYETAFNIVNRKIELQLEPLRIALDFTKFFYEDNRQALSKSEDRAFQTKIKELDRQYEDQKAVEKYKADLQLSAVQNGVQIPSYVLAELNRAKTVEEAANVLARNGISLQDPIDRQIKQAQLAKLGVELEKTRLENIASQVGATSPYQKERQVRTLESVKELRDRVSIQTVGFAGLARFLPASLPANFKTDLDTLKATIAFGELTAMREASKTGGALGQVSNVELGLLESALGGLSQTQSPANFKKNLDKIEASIKRWQGAANSVSEEDQLRALGYTEEQIQQIKSAQ